MWQIADAARLARLNPAQLREWTKRGIVDPDVAGRGAGHPALFAWQTVLVVSAIAELRQSFGIELGRWASSVEAAREAVGHISFLRLWGGQLVFREGGSADVEWKLTADPASNVRVALDPHLTRLASEMRLPGAPSQLPLLAPIGVGR